MLNYVAFMVNVANLIRQNRQLRGWDQGQLARRAGVTRGVVAHLESGRTVQMRALRRVAAAFSLPTAALLPESERA